jgi:hypothetical protein
MLIDRHSLLKQIAAVALTSMAPLLLVYPAD